MVLLHLVDLLALVCVSGVRLCWKWMSLARYLAQKPLISKKPFRLSVASHHGEIGMLQLHAPLVFRMMIPVC